MCQQSVVKRNATPELVTGAVATGRPPDVHDTAS